jgi:hypothetical protein
MADKLKNTTKSATPAHAASVSEEGRTVRALPGRRTQLKGRTEYKHKVATAVFNLGADDETQLKQTLLIES